MSIRKLLVATALLLSAASPVFADCAADATVREVRDAFARGQQKEQEGNARGPRHWPGRWVTPPAPAATMRRLSIITSAAGISPPPTAS
jgi:hypothetical protein